MIQLVVHENNKERLSHFGKKWIFLYNTFFPHHTSTLSSFCNSTMNSAVWNVFNSRSYLFYTILLNHLLWYLLAFVQGELLFTGHHTQIPPLGPSSMAAPIGYARLDFFLQVFKIGEKKVQINNNWAQRPLEIRNNYSHSNKFGQRKKCKEGRAVFLIIKEHISLPKR